MKHIRLVVILVLSLCALANLTSCHNDFETTQLHNPYPLTDRVRQPFYLNIKVYDAIGQDMCELGEIKPGDVYAEYKDTIFNLGEDANIILNSKVTLSGLSFGDPIPTAGVGFNGEGKVLRFGELDMSRCYFREEIILHWADGTRDVISCCSTWGYDTYNKWWRFPSTQLWINNVVQDPTNFFAYPVILHRPYIAEG